MEQPTQDESPRPIKKNFLTKEQKEKIRELVDKYGCNYYAIGKIMKLSPRKIREHIRANIIQGSSKTFTLQEDILLVNLVNEIGNKWTFIAERLGTKSSMMCRNRYRLIKKHCNEQYFNSLFKTVNIYSKSTSCPQFFDEFGFVRVPTK